MNQNQRAVFVSDIHLDDHRDERYQAFLSLLKCLGSEIEVTHLFLVGDIFDLWIESHEFFRNKFADVIAEIRRLASSGIEVHYFEGNHDLYLQAFWQNELGVSVHPGPAVFEINGQRVRVEHGDQMDPEDRGYLFLRWFLRTSFMKVIAKHLPGQWVASIGASASRHSRAYTSEIKTASEEKSRNIIRKYAERVYSETPFDLMISGHLHVKDDWSFDGGKARSVNLGTWLSRDFEYFHLAKDSGQMVAVD